MFNIETCKFVIWGAKRPYNTFGHIHEAFLRALLHMGKQAVWLENGDDLTGLDFENTLFLSMNTVIGGMPQRQDCVYVIHNIFGDRNQPYFDGLKMLGTGVHITPNVYSKNVEVLGKDIYFEPDERSLQMRWGTDLLPHEIEANKPRKVFNEESTDINYIGTVDPQKQGPINDFTRACQENGIRFNTYGGFNCTEHPGIQEHVELIRRSYMAPAFQGLDQVRTGYISCRLFKNISAGQYGVTHSKYANELFGNKLIYHEDGYRLFHEARERLASIRIEELHALMDDVKENHTYLNKIRAIEHAVRDTGEPMINLICFTSNRPDFIDLQVKSFKKYLQEGISPLPSRITQKFDRLHEYAGIERRLPEVANPDFRCRKGPEFNRQV